MKTLTDTTTRPTFTVNCILSPVKGEQVFCDIRLPLQHGEQIVRAFLEGFAAAKGLTLAKVSMCVYQDDAPDFRVGSRLVKWYNDCNGKLYFSQDQI